MKLFKTLLSYGLVLAIVLGLLEASSRLFFPGFTGMSFDRKALEERRVSRLAELDSEINPAADAAKALYQFHPYIGYMGTPGAHPWGEKHNPFNAYGMLSVADHPYPYRRQGNEYVVAVVGGSVADLFANQGEKYVQRIAREKYGIERKFVLLNLATGGYKQPQQLFHLQFALLSGFEIDAVLNLDGFNDLVLATQNLENGINPLYPSGHHLGLMSKLTGIPDRNTIQAMASFYELQVREARLLNLLQQAPFRHSVFGALLGEIWMKYSEAQISQAEYALTEDAHRALSVAFRGPPLPTADAATPIRVWQQASTLLNAAARAQRLTYVHALQPNQYVKGSKPLTEREKEIAHNPTTPWSKTASKGYGQLRAAGERLRAEGLPFYDLTGIFEGNSEDIYHDTCCHFGERGNEIMAEALVPIIIDEQLRQNRKPVAPDRMNHNIGRR